MDISKSFLKKFLTSIVFIVTFGFATTINVPADYATIQAGIDAASNGDTVLVAEGTYYENITWPNTGNIKLLSASGPELTIIDGDASGTVMTFDGGLALGTSTMVKGFTVQNGLASSGPGISVSFASFLEGNSPPSLFENMIIKDNVGSYGGGMWLNPMGTGNITIRNSVFTNNVGSAIHNQICDNSDIIVENCLIYGNDGGSSEAGAFGSAGDYYSGYGLRIINSTIVNNTGGFTGGILMYTDANVYLRNSILYNNTPNELTTIGDIITIDVDYTLLTNGSDVTIYNSGIGIQENWGDNIYQGDPGFVDYDNNDFHLSEYSQLIGAGTTTGAPTTDIEGNPRPNPAGSNPDMGAYENPYGVPQYQPQVLNVPADYSNIQAALTAANATDTVLVQPGTYTENIIWPETNGIKLISAGDSSNTIIDGGGVSSVIYMNPQSATIDTTTLIQGFKITNGGSVGYGGGICIIGASAKIKGNIVANNTAYYKGGGLYNSGLSLICEYSVISGNAVSQGNNSSSDGGGGIYNEGDAALFSNLRIFDNSSEDSGGGIQNYGSLCLFDNLEIHSNSAANSGGGINNNSANSIYKNSIIYNNSAVGGGGGIYSTNTGVSFINLSISYNSAQDGAGMRLWYATLDNVLINNNSASRSGGAAYCSGNITINNSKILSNTVNGNPGNGGGLYLHQGSITLSNTVIVNNSSSDYGGGIFNSVMSATYSNVTISDNNAQNGGALYNPYEEGSNTLSNVTLFNNSASNDYNGIYNSSGTVSITNSNFINNENALYNENSLEYVSATNNYWGHTSGPYHPSQNLSGAGDSVNALVNVDPWLTEPNIDAPPIPAQNTLVTGSGNDFISLNWDASLIGDLAGYKLYYDSDSSGYPYANSIDIGTETSYTLSGLQLGTTYYLAVTTYDTDGNESWYSNEVSGVTRIMQAQSLDIGGDEDLQHMVSHTPSITFNYYDSMNETQTSYQIQVSENPNYDSATLWWDSGEVSGSDTSATYAGETLEDGVTYYLRVKVGAGTFYSDWSNLTFRMNTEPTTPVLVSPINDQVTATPVILNVFNAIDAESDVVTYSFNVYDDATLTTKLDSATALTEDTDTTSWQVTATLPDNEQYFWTVSTNDGYEESAVSDAGSFLLNIANDAPAAFALTYPTDTSEVTTTLPTLLWQTSTDPDPIDTVRYMVQFGSTIPDLETFYTDTMTSYQFIIELEDNTDYFWRVIAEDVNGASTENTGGYHSFRVNTANDLPGDFALISPEDESIVTDLTPSLYWEVPVDPDDRSRSIVSYHVYLDTSLTGTIPDTVSTNSYTASNLLEDVMYYWKIVAVDDDGGTNESAIWSFWMNGENSPPSEFSLVEPLNNAVLDIFNPPFCWEESTDPDIDDQVNYILVLGEHIDSLTIIYNGPFMQSCFYETMDLVEDNTVYYWKVTAVDLSGATTENNGGFHSFIINTENDPPTASTLVAPLNESIQTDLTPNFYWTEADDPDPMDHISYTMHWWPMGMLPVIYSANTDSNSFTPEENLTDNSQFGWMVTANDMHGAESNSDSSYFYTDALPEPPANFATITPENNAEGIATEVEFIWEQTDDPDPVEEIQYQLVYATDWADSSTYVFSELIQDTSLTVTLANNSQYYWIVVAMDTDGFMVGSDNNTPMTVVVGTLSIDGADLPEVFALHQNYPNPFNPTTTLKYDLPEDAMVNITIYDMMGRVVKTMVNSEQNAGFKSVRWNATNDNGSPASAGLYLYTIQAGEFRQTKKMVLLK
jgi:hypothetical protein